MHEIQDKDLINKKRIDQNAKKRKEKIDQNDIANLS